MNRFAGLVRRCIEDYSMIENGDKIAVGVSGGKDSLALLAAMSSIRGYYPEKFELFAVTVDLGFENMDYSHIDEFCRSISVPYIIKRTDIKNVVFDERHEKNPCSLCAKMRRGSLCDLLNENGIKKIALGHHFDDAVETFMMSLLFEGRISCFQPVTYLDRSGITQLRPMLYVGEGTVRKIADRYSLPVVENTCPMDSESKRHEIKRLITDLSKSYPDLKSKVFGAMQRLPLDGWRPNEYKRRPLP